MEDASFYGSCEHRCFCIWMYPWAVEFSERTCAVVAVASDHIPASFARQPAKINPNLSHWFRLTQVQTNAVHISPVTTIRSCARMQYVTGSNGARLPGCKSGKFYNVW